MKTASKTLITFKSSLPYYLYFVLLKVEFWLATATYSPQTSSTTIAVAAPAVAICLNSLITVLQWWIKKTKENRFTVRFTQPDISPHKPIMFPGFDSLLIGYWWWRACKLRHWSGELAHIIIRRRYEGTSYEDVEAVCRCDFRLTSPPEINRSGR